MTTEEKLQKLRRLADAMYYAAQQLTTDASWLHKAMDEYHQFIIHEYKEEPVSEEFEKALAKEWQGYVDRGAATVDALEDNTQELAFAKGFYRGAKWQKKQMLTKAVDALVHTFDNGYIRVGTQLLANNESGLKVGDKVKVIVIKEE